MNDGMGQRRVDGDEADCTRGLPRVASVHVQLLSSTVGSVAFEPAVTVCLGRDVLVCSGDEVSALQQPLDVFLPFLCAPST